MLIDIKVVWKCVCSNPGNQGYFNLESELRHLYLLRIGYYHSVQLYTLCYKTTAIPSILEHTPRVIPC